MYEANAALSGEQRRPLNLTHCAVNTLVEANRKCRALGIRLKCFVIRLFEPGQQTKGTITTYYRKPKQRGIANG